MAEYFRVERTEGFTVMSVFHLRDKTLSMRAKGLLSFILQLPPDWKFSTRGLAANMKDGVDAVTETLRELERAGYIARRRLRDEKGHYKDTMYTIYEKPRSNGNPSPSGSPSPSSEAPTPDSTSPDQESPDPGIPYQEIPDVGFPDEAFPDADSPAQEKPALLSTNSPNTDISKKKRESTNASSMNQSNHYHINPEKNSFAYGVESMMDDEAGFYVGVPSVGIQKVLIPIESVPYPTDEAFVDFAVTFGAAVITKTDAGTGAALAGATFEVVNTSGAVVATAKTGADGTAVFESLQAGTYTIRETSAPTGYTLSVPNEPDSRCRSDGQCDLRQ